MYTSMFWVTLAGDSTYFGCGGEMGFYDASMSVKVKVPQELMTQASNDEHNEMNDTKGVRIG